MRGPEAFSALWDETPEYRSLCDGLNKGHPRQAAFGLPAGQLTFLLAALYRALDRPFLVIAAGFQESLDLATDLRVWLSGVPVLYFPPLEIVPYHVVARSPDVVAERIAVLAHLSSGGKGVVVAPVGALLRPLAPPAQWSAATVLLRSGESADPAAIVARLQAGGYERVARVEAPGQFSVRGGILDVFPLPDHEPVRAEFFGDVVESLRAFDVASQRSVGAVAERLIPPAREVVLPPEGAEAAVEAVRAEMEAAVARLRAMGRDGDAESLRERVLGHLTGLSPSVWELYAPYMYSRPEGRGAPATLIDYFQVQPLVVVVEPARVEEALAGAQRQWEERIAGLTETGRLLPAQASLQLGEGEFKRRLAQEQALYCSSLAIRLPGIEPDAVYAFKGAQVPVMRGQWELFLEELRGWLGQRYRCCITVSSAERAARLQAALTEAGVPVPVDGETAAQEWLLPEPGQAAVVVAPLERGFIAQGLRLVLATEGEVFGRRKRPPRATRGPEGARIASYHDLKVGDYVVHVHHGIGQYLGIKTMVVQGVQRDYLYIKYEGSDRLYVPVDQIQLVQKYVGGEGRQPRLYKLGGGEWARVKQRVKESVRRMAEELLQLYAARQTLEGHAFSPDTVWQREFEEAFPYEETADQLQAIAEIKRDMELPRPMDRLLCGDVGFGKTEVAMRAAFKAVMDGKQVAVLVPTTVLAQQHYLTFRERFSGFPVRIGVLSRFRTPKEQEEVITGLRKGEVDIVIGTHRLLGGDVSFKDLGLLIIDEEHRFGVAHKEALKRLRSTVDVLTLTATPIPRTLHMSLAGLRDMSVIATPPENRFPVETYVVEYDEQLIRDAIERELARGGQVFYVHNRVQTIHGALRRLQQLVPHARVALAHGQMPEHELEDVMMEFLAGRHDILLCTSIIESGLDIPNANTLIVEDSDRFGLAQLYQIRGRVGRSHRLAYAYFTYRPNKLLGEVAQKRLEAIKEFTELGSGFKIAMRDLEIRGAGNILGPEQHGFIVSVGFDLYCQLLGEAVRELKGEKAVPRTEPVVELAVDAYLDDGYVPEARAKIEFYRKINAADSLDAVEDAAAELVDRYGPLPPPAENLLALARVKVLASDLGILSLTQERDAVRIAFPGYLKELARELEPLRAGYGRRLVIHLTPRPMLTLKLSGGGRPPTEEVLGLLVAIAQVPAIQRWLGSARRVLAPIGSE